MEIITQAATDVNRKENICSKDMKRISEISHFTEILTLLRDRTEKECAAVIDRVGNLKRFPWSLDASIYGAANFFGVDITRMYGVVHYITRRYPTRHIYSAMYHINSRSVIEVAMKCRSDITFTRSDGTLYAVLESGEKYRMAHSRYDVWFITPKGMIILAYYFFRAYRPDGFQVANLVVKECEKSGLLTASQEPAPEDDRPGDFYRIKQVYQTPTNEKTEPEADPAPSRQMDYAETLRKLFDSVLTLVQKQAEERGAEKIIQKLKEEGKL